MTDRLFVSVIIPAYNCEAFLADAVESVRRQAYPRLELIIVDDGSTDGTATVAKGLKDLDVHYAYQQNGGPARARNHGLGLARGEVIVFHDADDLWPADRLSRQLPYLERDPLIDVVLGQVQLFRSVPHADGGSKIQLCSPPFHQMSPVEASIRRRVFERVGGFDETMRFGEDIDWFMRAREQSVPMVVHDDVVRLYRRHESNMTRGRDVKELHLPDVLKKSLDRRRQQHQGVATSLPNVFDFADRSRRPVDPSAPHQDT